MEQTFKFIIRRAREGNRWPAWIKFYARPVDSNNEVEWKRSQVDAAIKDGSAVFQSDLEKAEKAKRVRHCQICDRQIEANNAKGVIAHHGYERPGQGWQTSSCFGARYLPFEKSCDRIPPYIEMIESYRDRQRGIVKTMTENPPRAFDCDKNSGFRKREPQPYSALRGDPKSPNREWEDIRTGTIRVAEYQITTSTREIEHMTKRLKNWKPAKEKK